MNDSRLTRVNGTEFTPLFHQILYTVERNLTYSRRCCYPLEEAGGSSKAEEVSKPKSSLATLGLDADISPWMRSLCWSPSLSSYSTITSQSNGMDGVVSRMQEPQPGDF